MIKRFCRTSTKKNALRMSIALLTKKQQRALFLVGLIQFFLGGLDLLGVALIGVLASLTLNGIESKQPGERISFILDFTNLEEFSFQSQALIFAMGATILLVSRSVFSVVITRKVLYFLSRRGAELAADSMAKHMSREVNVIAQRTTQETIYLLTVGVVVISLGILGTLVILSADIILLLVMMLGLFAIDPLIAVVTVVLFGCIGFALYVLLSKKAQYLGELNSRLGILNAQQVQDSIQTYRELHVKNRVGFFADNFKKTRFELANVLSEIQFLPNISKYVIESSVIVSATVISAIQFLLLDAKQAIATLSIFLVAGSRITPALMRIQQNAIQLRSSLSFALPTLEFLEELEGIQVERLSEKKRNLKHNEFTPHISVSNLDFGFQGSERYIIRDLNLEIFPGERLAIVGESGVGKSTLIDLMLGIIKSEKGKVLISGYQPSEAIIRWPGAIAYVPQKVHIIPGTLMENIILGFNVDEIESELLLQALQMSQLVDLVRETPEGLDMQLQGDGSNLSGGQRQRIGIARALLTNPKLIVLDEATSSLDGTTEYKVTQAIDGLDANVTIIAIAHRLSTIQNFDKIVYLKGNGEYLMGNFKELRQDSEEFDAQAKLMGL